MKINKNDFLERFRYGIFSNFEMKFYEDAVVMKRWETPKDENVKAECYETPMYYHDDRYVSYVVNVPKPSAPVCTGMILLLRMSKNHYRAAIDNGKEVVIEVFSTLKELERFCERIFA